MVNKTCMTPVYLSMTCAAGESACPQLQENGYRMVVYLWDLNVDFINWYLAPEIGILLAQHGTY